MSRLERFAKESSREIRQTTLRCSADLYREFKRYVAELNMNVNEAIVKLMELELSEAKQKSGDLGAEGVRRRQPKRVSGEGEANRDSEERWGKESGREERVEAKIEAKRGLCEDIGVGNKDGGNRKS